MNRPSREVPDDYWVGLCGDPDCRSCVPDEDDMNTDEIEDILRDARVRAESEIRAGREPEAFAYGMAAGRLIAKGCYQGHPAVAEIHALMRKVREAREARRAA